MIAFDCGRAECVMGLMIRRHMTAGSELRYLLRICARSAAPIEQTTSQMLKSECARSRWKFEVRLRPHHHKHRSGVGQFRRILCSYRVEYQRRNFLPMPRHARQEVVRWPWHLGTMFFVAFADAPPSTALVNGSTRR